MAIVRSEFLEKILVGFPGQLAEVRDAPHVTPDPHHLTWSLLFLQVGCRGGPSCGGTTWIVGSKAVAPVQSYGF